MRLIAILREPAARAYSAHRYNVMLGNDPRSFADAIGELLQPERLTDARTRPDGTNGYVVLGEYARILRRYFELFGPDRLHVCFTEDLERDPAGVMRRICEYLGVDPAGATADPAVRHHHGGTSLRVDGDAEASLKRYLDEHAWSGLPESQAMAERSAFTFWFRLWNIVPEDETPPVPPDVQAVLAEHFRADTTELEALLGRPVTWAYAGAGAGADPAGAS